MNLKHIKEEMEREKEFRVTKIFRKRRIDSGRERERFTIMKTKRYKEEKTRNRSKRKIKKLLIEKKNFIEREK